MRDDFLKFAKTLRLDDEVVIEVTGNSAAVGRLLRPFVKRVIIANPRLVKAIVYARVKTDKVDAKVLAQLQAAGLLPEVWIADDATQRRRRQIAERMGVLAQLVRTKGESRWTTQAEARQALFGYIEGYYNRHRMHSALGYLTPEQAEQRMTD